MKLSIRLICVVLIGITIAAAALPARVRALSGPLATLDPVSGLIQYQTAGDNPQDLAAWKTVIAPVLIGEGDRIRTDGAGFAYLTFFEGIQTEVRANTLVVVSTLEIPAAGSVNISLDVLVGTTFNSIQSSLGPNDRFEVHTPGATAVVRGTEWWTFVEPNGESTFATESGVVKVLFHGLRAAAPDEAAVATEETPMAAAPAPDELGNFVAMSSLEEGGLVRASRDGARLAGLDSFQLPSRDVQPVRALVVATCGDGICRPIERRICPVDCLDRSELSACGDGVCDPEANEDLLVCPSDCGPFAGAACGNGTCDADESGVTCPADCEPDQYFSPIDPSLCGNETCDATESALSCPADCGG